MNVVKLISKASECNINQFLSCAFDNDYSVLIVSGKPSPKQLQDAWENILIEFNDSSGQSASMEELVLMKQILMLQARTKAMEMFVFAHEQAALHPKCPILTDVSLFEKYGYNIQFNGDKKDYLKQLQTVKQGELSYVIDLNDLTEELKKLQSKNEKVNSTSSRSNFLRQIKNIEVFYKMPPLDFEKYSVERLAILINDFREMVENQNNDNSMN